MENKIEGYEKLKPLGSVPYNTFVVLRNKDKLKMIAKEINYKKYDKTARKRIVDIINSLVQLRSDSVVRYHNCVVDNGHLILIADYYQNGSLHYYIKSEWGNISEDRMWDIITDIALGLYECHNHKPNQILHGNLNSKNVFLDESYNVKIGNFSLDCSNVGEEKDLMNFGFIIYELVTGNVFDKEQFISQMQSPKLNEGFKELLYGLFKKNFSLLDILEFPEVSLKILEKKIKLEKIIYEKEKAKYLKLESSFQT